MDEDGNGVIDRMEWISYLCAPPLLNGPGRGNPSYYDFELRHIYDTFEDSTGLIGLDEMCNVIKHEQRDVYDLLDGELRDQAEPCIRRFA